MHLTRLQAAFSALTTFLFGFPNDLDTAGPVCVRPSVRKEWRALSTTERSEWNSAIQCLAALPHDNAFDPLVSRNGYMPPFNTSASYYDDIVFLHMNMDEQIHFTGLFLPWHRWYIHSFEIALRQKCGFKGATPYWDWTQDASDVHASTMFQDNDRASGLGGWGTALVDHRVQDGAFSSFHLSYPSPHILRRKFDLYPYLKSLQPEFLTDPTLAVNTTFSKDVVERLLNDFDGNYRGFQTYLEDFQGPHSGVHLVLGGDMASSCHRDAPIGCKSGSKWSSNEPLFWMHHAMIDKIWYDWQRGNEVNANAFGGGSVQHIENVTIYQRYPTGAPPLLSINSVIHGDGLFPDVKILDMMDTIGGYLCYVYG